MTNEEFENILNRSESEILDFKREQYDIIENSNENNLAKFIKDIISFCNTIRTETAYIILGIGITERGGKELVGLNKNIDDAIFQEKMKNKVTPIPYFNYSTIRYKEKYFGIITIPIKKYNEPIFPVVKLKGLESGKVYFRRSSSNSEATGREVILINKWLESLPSTSETNFYDEVSNILNKITSKQLPLSEQITSSLKLARSNNLLELQKFCEGELLGWYEQSDKIIVENELPFRMKKILVSQREIEFNPYSYISLTAQQVINEIKRLDKYATYYTMFFPQPITELEEYRTQFQIKGDSTIMTLKNDAGKLFSNSKFDGIKVTSYTTPQDIENIYQGIRQKLISLLVEI